MTDPADTSAQEESLFHQYTGNDIPWFVRVIWILFWIFAIVYALRWALPLIPVEMESPP